MNNDALVVSISVLTVIVMFCFLISGGLHNPNNKLGKFGQKITNKQCNRENKKLNPVRKNDKCTYTRYNDDTGCWGGKWDGKAVCEEDMRFDRVWAYAMIVVISILFILCVLFAFNFVYRRFF